MVNSYSEIRERGGYRTGTSISDMTPDYEALKELPLQILNWESHTDESLFKLLRSSTKGISSNDALQRLELFRSNKLEEKKVRATLNFLKFFWNPLAWVSEAAAVMAITLTWGVGKPPDWQDFIGIVVVLFIDATIGFIVENRASNAAAALMARFSRKARVFRDDEWSRVDASFLVPGDLISIKPGDIVAAHIRLLEGNPLKIYQPSLPGEYSKSSGQMVPSGSICIEGECNAVVCKAGIITSTAFAHLADSKHKREHLQKVFMAVRNFCICTIIVGILLEIMVMYQIQDRSYLAGIYNLLALFGGIPIAMPTVLSVTMTVGSHRLSQQGAITKRMEAIERMASMDVLCSDIPGTLTLNKLTIKKSDVRVLESKETVETVILMAARATQMDSQDAIDAAILDGLPDPKDARAGIQEVEFIHSDSTQTCTYIDNESKRHRARKGAPQEILDLLAEESASMTIARHTTDFYVKSWHHCIAVACQEVTDETIKSPWRVIGLIPLLYTPRADSAGALKRGFDINLQVKIITDHQRAKAKEAADKLGVEVGMFPYESKMDWNTFEGAGAFYNVSPAQKNQIIERLQARDHICGMIGNGVNDTLALRTANIGIAVENATDAACDASDIVLTKPDLEIIKNAVLTSRAIIQRINSFMIYVVSSTIRIVLGFMLLALIWKFDFPPFMVPIIVILNVVTIITISKDRVEPSLKPNSWKLHEIFTTGIALGGYLAVITVLFFWAATESNYFPHKFGVETLQRGSPDHLKKVASAVYLQVTSSSQALIFVTRARSWSFFERPGYLIVLSFLCAQMVAAVIAVYANWGFAAIQGIGWKWAGVIWLYNIIFYFPLDVIKLMVQHLLSWKRSLHVRTNPVVADEV